MFSFIDETIKIIVNTKYIIITPLAKPYIIPPISLNCLIIGIFDKVSVKNPNKIKAILILINNINPVIISVAFIEITSAAVSTAFFFASFPASATLSSIYFSINVFLSSSFSSSILSDSSS